MDSSRSTHIAVSIVLNIFVQSLFKLILGVLSVDCLRCTHIETGIVANQLFKIYSYGYRECRQPTVEDMLTSIAGLSSTDQSRTTHIDIRIVVSILFKIYSQYY